MARNSKKEKKAGSSLFSKATQNYMTPSLYLFCRLIGENRQRYGDGVMQFLVHVWM